MSTVFQSVVVGKALAETESQKRRIELDRMAAMLSRLGKRGCWVKEDAAVYGLLREQNCPFGIVVNNDEMPRMYTENIAGIPFVCL